MISIGSALPENDYLSYGLHLLPASSPQCREASQKGRNVQVLTSVDGCHLQLGEEILLGGYEGLCTLSMGLAYLLSISL